MKSEDKVSKTNNNNAHKITNIKQIKNTNKTQTDSQYNKSLWNQKQYQVATWIKPKLQQSLSRRIVDKLPHFKSFPSIIQTSIGSSILSITKEREIKKKTNKVDQFLISGKVNNTTKQKCKKKFKKKRKDEIINKNQTSIESNTQYSFTIKTLKSNSYINQQSLQSSSTQNNRE